MSTSQGPFFRPWCTLLLGASRRASFSPSPRFCVIVTGASARYLGGVPQVTHDGLINRCASQPSTLFHVVTNETHRARDRPPLAVADGDGDRRRIFTRLNRMINWPEYFRRARALARFAEDNGS